MLCTEAGTDPGSASPAWRRKPDRQVAKEAVLVLQVFQHREPAEPLRSARAVALGSGHCCSCLVPVLLLAVGSFGIGTAGAAEVAGAVGGVEAEIAESFVQPVLMVEKAMVRAH